MNAPRLAPWRRRAAAWLDAPRALGATDLKVGLRLMRRQPMLTLTATAALALGIGLSMVGFAFMEALLFSRLPFDGGDRFVRLRLVQEPEGRRAEPTPDDYQRLSAQATTLEHIGALDVNRDNVTLPSGAVDTVTTAAITPSSLRLLPHGPVRGRLLASSDGTPGALPVAMVREGFWRRALASADDVVGMRLEVGGVERTIVGVVPDDFQLPPATPDLWLPIDEGFLAGRGVPEAGAGLFGVLAPGRSLDAAQEQLRAIAAGIAPAPGATGPVRIEAAGFTDLGPPARAMAAAAVGAVLAVLIVVAANVGNLVLARSFTRSRELALRAALGASRAWRPTARARRAAAAWAWRSCAPPSRPAGAAWPRAISTRTAWRSPPTRRISPRPATPAPDP